MAYRVVGVLVEKVPPKLGCGGPLVVVILFVLWFIGEAGSSSSESTFVPSPTPPTLDVPPAQTVPSPPRLDAREPTDPVPPPAKRLAPDTTRRSALGIIIADINQMDPAARAKLGEIGDSGVVVTRVTSGGPADAAGIHPGDVVLAFNDNTVSTGEALQALVAGGGIGSSATVRVRRAGQVLSLSATLQAVASRADSSPPPALTLPSPSPENDGTDAAHPMLAPDDSGFVDTRGGSGWGDRCWLNLKAGKLGWAKAECLKGMALGPASPNPRASLLYNLGLIEKKAGDSEQARQYFERSLALREHAQVRAALNSLP